MSHSASGAALRAHPREVLRLGAWHESVSGTLRDIVDEVARNGYLRFRLLAQTHADSVADTVGKQCADAHRTLDASVLAFASLGDAEVERIVHVRLVHLGDEQTHRAHHDDRVRRLDAYHYVVELFLLADAQKLHTALDDAFRRVAVARHDAVGERTVVHADAHRCVVFAADVEEGHEAVLQFLEFVGILCVGILNLLEHARRVYVVARVHAHLLCVQSSHVSHVGVEVNVGNERCGVAVGTQLCVYVLQVLSLSAALRSESHEFAACLYDALSLSHARLRVVGVGCGHRLHAYRGVAAKLYVTYLNG